MTDAEFRAWLARDNEVRCVLFELDYVDEGTDSPIAPVTRTLYLSDRVFFDDVTNNAYIDVIRAAPQYSRSLSGDQLGRYTSSIGALELDNADAQLDFLLNLACDGSQIRAYYGGQLWPVADFKHIYSAIISKVSVPSWDRISVTLKDTGLLLNKSIGGTVTIGGTGPNADRSRMADFGYLHNITPLVIDETIGGGKYAYADAGTGTVTPEVRDRGVSVAYTDNLDGTFTLTSAPTQGGPVTCDVLAEPLGDGNVLVSDAIDHFVGDRAGLVALSLYDGAGPTFTVGDDDDYPVGVMLPEARNVIDLLDDLVIESGNAFWAIKRTGEFTFGRLRLNDIADLIADSPPAIEARDIVEDDIVPAGSFSIDHAPTQYYRFQAYMSRNWTRQTTFATSLSPDEQAIYSRNGLYLMQPASVGTDYESAPELYNKTLAVSPVIDTLLSEEFSAFDLDRLAQWMTTRRAILLPWIEIVSLTVAIDFFELELGDPVRLFNPRFGSDDGVLFQVIAITIRLTEARVDLRIARRNIIQPVPDAWLRLQSAQDSTQPEYTPGPPTIEAVDMSPIAVIGGGAPGAGAAVGASFINMSGNWRLTFLRPKLIVPPLHPDVMLYVTMLGGDYTDHSSYANTATNTNFAANGDLFECYHNTGTSTSGTQKVRYGTAGGTGNVGFNFSTSDSVTIEGFFKWVASDNNTGPWTIFMWETGTIGSQNNEKTMLYANAGQWAFDNASAGTEAGPSTGFGGALANTLTHWALVYDGSANTMTFYTNGVQRMTYARGSLDKTDGTSWVEIGGVWNTSTGGFGIGLIHAYIGETRMVRRKLYSSNFTPPTPYNLIPIT